MATAIRASKYFIYDGSPEGATRVRDCVGRGAVYVSNMSTAGTSGPLYFTPDVGNIVAGSAVMFYVNGDGDEVYTDTWSAEAFARDFVDIETLIVDTTNFVSASTMDTAMATKASTDTTDTLSSRVAAVNTNLTGRFAKGSLEKTITAVGNATEDFVIPLSATMNDANYDVTTGIEATGATVLGGLAGPVVVAKTTTHVTCRVKATGALNNLTVKVAVVCRAPFVSMA